MRLIDADELKTHKFLSPQVRILGGRRNGKVIFAVYQQGWNDAIDAIINNAPTVEAPTELCKGCRFLKDCETCEEKLRPQGEWIDHSEDEGYLECPICGCLTNCDGNKEELHYCWNCGADMRGGKS